MHHKNSQNQDIKGLDDNSSDLKPATKKFLMYTSQKAFHETSL
jgi:hypothetical protein